MAERGEQHGGTISRARRGVCGRPQQPRRSFKGPGHTSSKTSDGAASAGDAGYGAGVKSPGRLALDAAFRKQADLRLGLAENLSQARAQNVPLDARVEQAFKDFDPSVPAKNEPSDATMLNRMPPRSTPSIG